MGTTRIKVIDLSSDKAQIKTSRKHAHLVSPAKRAEKLGATAKLKTEEKPATAATPKPIAQPEAPATAQAVEQPTPAQTTQDKITKPAAAAAKPSLPRRRGKKYLQVAELIFKDKAYTAQEALNLLQKTSIAKFDPTVEVHLNVLDKNMRGKINFPHSPGPQKEKKYLVLSDERPKVDEKQIIWGDEKTITQIESGQLKPIRDFDVVVSTPKFMPHLAKVAKILGPKGLMPNPKNGTILENVAQFFKGDKDTGLEYRTDPMAPIIHTKIGKLSTKPQHLEENLKALILAIGPTKIKKAVIKSTMSPGIKLDTSTFSAS